MGEKCEKVRMGMDLDRRYESILELLSVLHCNAAYGLKAFGLASAAGRMTNINFGARLMKLCLSTPPLRACSKGAPSLSHRTVYITQRCRCSYQNGYMIVRQDEQTMIHLSEISLVVVESTAAYVSSYLLAELAQARIPVLFCDVRHNPVGQFMPLYGAHDSARRVKEQVLWRQGVKDALWARIIASKIGNQAVVLERMGLVQAAMLRVCGGSESGGFD